MSVKDTIIAIRNLPPFPNEKFVDRLYNKTRESPSIRLLADKLPYVAQYGEDPHSLFIDGVDATRHLDLFAEQAAVQALASLDDSADKYNLRGCVNSSTAQIAADTVMANVTSLLYGEHVNWFLRSGKLLDLAALAHVSGFADEFAKELQEPRFVHSEILTDMVNHTSDYSVSLLFICEYLYRGPGLLPYLDRDFMSCASGKVLATWITQLSAIPQVKYEDVITFGSKAASVVHVTTGPEGNIKPQSLIELARSIFSEAWLDALSHPDKGPFSHVVAMSSDAVASITDIMSAPELRLADIKHWKHITELNMKLWANTKDNWQTALIAHTTSSTSTTKETNTDDGSQFGRGFLLGLTFGLDDHQTWETTTATGQTVADWINQRRSIYDSLFTKGAPSVTAVTNTKTDSSPILHSCFITGTQIATDKGPIAIEAVTEGTRVLTDAASKSYGIASDEDVVTPLSVALMVGINGENPFFTPGHVFHTSTGLRAVVPVAARRENPHINVGRLEPGHVLYRLAADGKSYDHVKVKSLQIHETDTKIAYGVHLREGQRSYHANGYLVVMNYPEVTVKSIARMLSTFSKEERVDMLKHIKELRPLFQKFGVSTMSEVLTRELQGEKRRDVAKPSHARHMLTSNLQQVRRAYQLIPLGENSAPGYVLPSIMVHEGVVLLDGVVQPRALIDPSTRQIRWTREVSGHCHEHGYVELVDHCLAGRGAVVLSGDPGMEKLPPKGSRELVSFTVVQANAQVDRPKRAHLAAAPSPTAQVPLPARPLTNFPPTLLAVNAAASSLAPPSDLADPDTITFGPLDCYDLIVDKDTWAKGTNKTALSSPTPFGQVALATYHTGGPAGLSLPIVTISHLDELRKEINKTRPLTPIGPLYSSVMERDTKGSLVGTVTFDEAGLIADLADKASDDAIVPTLGLTFKAKLNSTFVLPILFKTLVVTLNWDGSVLEGSAYAYDAGMRGCVGARYKVINSNTTSSLTFAVRSANADAMAASFPNSSLASASAIASPALVTQDLADAVPLTVEALTQMSGYKESDVHGTSQTLLQNMMYYHMNDNDRKKFLQFPKPTDLPIELAENLDQNLAKWIHDTYAPAYIIFMLSQVESEDVHWRDGLTDEEKSKAWYWWSGSGDTCLAKSQQYNELNKITAAAAMQKLYGRTLSPYLADTPTVWAARMIDGLTKAGGRGINSLLKNPLGGSNVINKCCNILNLLDPMKNYADTLFKASLDFIVTSNSNNQYIGHDDPTGIKGREWLFDAMLALGTLVLDNSSTLDHGVRESLQKDLADLEKEYGDLSNLTNNEKMRHMLTRQDELNGNLSKWMTAIGSGLKALKGVSGFRRAGAIYDKVLSKLPAAESKKGAMLKGLGTIVMAGFYIGMSYSSFVQWDILDPVQRASIIIPTLQMAVDIAGRSIATFKNFKKWGGGETPSAEQSIDGSVLDQGTGDVLSSEKTAAALESEAATTNGPTGLRGSAAERAQEFGPPEKQLPAEDGESFEVPLEDDPNAPLPEGVPPAGTRAARNFNTSANWLKAANILLGIALTVSMSLDLKNHWDDMNTFGKILSTIQVLIQGLTVLCDVVILATDLAVEGGLLAADAALVFALPIVGAVLAVIGLVVMVILMIFNTSAKKDPPLSPVETFLHDVAHTTIKNWAAAPLVTLQYDVPDKVEANAAPATITFTVSNTSSQIVTLVQTSFTLEGGDDAACLFTNTKMAVATAEASGTVYTDPSTLVSAALVANIRKDTLTSYNFNITGATSLANKSGKLILKSRESFKVLWTGIINKAGSTTLQIVESGTNGDRCRLLKTIQRV